MRPRFPTVALYVLAAPAIWAAHFAVVYGYAALECARRLPEGSTMWVIVAAAVIAATTIAGVMRRAMHGGFDPGNDTERFLRWTTVALGALALLAIVWETLLGLLAPACV